MGLSWTVPECQLDARLPEAGRLTGGQGARQAISLRRRVHATAILRWVSRIGLSNLCEGIMNWRHIVFQTMPTTELLGERHFTGATATVGSRDNFLLPQFTTRSRSPHSRPPCPPRVPLELAGAWASV